MISIDTLYVLGDSISKGCVQNLEVGKKYSVYPENMWKIVAGINSLNLVNKSVFGATIIKGHKQLSKDIENGLTADACVIEFGGNDCDYRWPDLFKIPEDEFYPNTKLPEFIEHLDEMVKEIKKRGIFPILMTLPPLVAERYFNMISEGLDREKLLEWMHDPLFLYRDQEVYSDAVALYAKENDVFLLDVRKQFLTTRNSPDLMCDDGIHPNQMGHHFMANYIDKVFKENFYMINSLNSKNRINF